MVGVRWEGAGGERTEGDERDGMGRDERGGGGIRTVHTTRNVMVANNQVGTCFRPRTTQSLCSIFQSICCNRRFSPLPLLSRSLSLSLSLSLSVSPRAKADPPHTHLGGNLPRVLHLRVEPGLIGVLSIDAPIAVIPKAPWPSSILCTNIRIGLRIGLRIGGGVRRGVGGGRRGPPRVRAGTILVRDCDRGRGPRGSTRGGSGGGHPHGGGALAFEVEGGVVVVDAGGVVPVAVGHGEPRAGIARSGGGHSEEKRSGYASTRLHCDASPIRDEFWNRFRSHGGYLFHLRSDPRRQQTV